MKKTDKIKQIRMEHLKMLHLYLKNERNAKTLNDYKRKLGTKMKKIDTIKQIRMEYLKIPHLYLNTTLRQKYYILYLNNERNANTLNDKIKKRRCKNE